MDMAANLSTKMDQMVDMFTTRMADFEKSSGTQSSNNPQTVKALSTEFVSFKSFVLMAIGMLKDQVQLLALAIDRQEAHSRRNVLLIQGMPETKDENVRSMVQRVLQDQLKLCGGDSAIDVCHRLGERKSRDRPVLVRFASIRFRSEVWNAKSKLKGSKVSLKEFLTRPRQEVFSAARTHFGMKKCWSSDGTVVVLLPDNERRKLVSMAELNELKKQYPDVQKP